MWVKIPRWTYGPRAAGCGFARHAETPGWGTGVPSSKTSAPVRPSVPNLVPKGCSQSAPAAGGLSRPPVAPGMLTQGCGEQPVTWVCTLVPQPSASTFPQEEWIKKLPLFFHVLPSRPELPVSRSEGGRGHRCLPWVPPAVCGDGSGVRAGTGVMLLTQVRGEEAPPGVSPVGSCLSVLSAKQEGGFQMLGVMPSAP